jgi:hypothetical protein
MEPPRVVRASEARLAVTQTPLPEPIAIYPVELVLEVTTELISEHDEPTMIYLPLILKSPPQTYLYVTSVNTGGINPVEIRNPNNGNILLLSCVIGNNVTEFCGSFPPVGTYTIIGYTRNCGLVQGTFNDALPETAITRRIRC